MDPIEITPDQLQAWGSTWSSGAGVNGLGSDAGQVNVGEFKVLRPAGSPALCTISLMFRRTTQNGILPINDPTFIYAHIQSGVGLASYTVEMDWAHGASITLPHQGVVKVNARQVGNNFGTGIAIAACCAIGPRSFAGFPTFTTMVHIPGDGSAVTVPIVERARWLIVPRQFSPGAIPVPGAPPPPPPYFPANFPADLIVRARGIGIPNDLAVWQQLDISDALLWQTGVMLPAFTDSITLESASGGGGAGNTQPVIWGLDG